MINDKTLNRFFSKVIPEPMSGCWLWTGSTTEPNGYGIFTMKGKKVLSHRFSLELSGTKIGAGLFACHRCNVKPCCNPDHLYVADNKTNVHHAIRDGLFLNQNTKKTECPRCGSQFRKAANGTRFCRVCRTRTNTKNKSLKRAATRAAIDAARGGKP